MSEYVFKNMSEVEELAAPTENTKVFGFENGELVQMPFNAVGAPPDMNAAEGEPGHVLNKPVNRIDFDIEVTETGTNYQVFAFTDLAQVQAAFDANMNIFVVVTASWGSGASNATAINAFYTIKDIHSLGLPQFALAPSTSLSSTAVLNLTTEDETVTAATLRVTLGAVVRVYATPF